MAGNREPAETEGLAETPADEAAAPDSTAAPHGDQTSRDPGAAKTTASPELIDRLTREREEYLDHLKRERAAFLNYKRQVSKDRHDWENAAVCRFVQGLLPFVDDLDRALKAAAAAPDVESLREGLEMVHTRLQEAFKAAGIEEIDANEKPFDPRFHDAVLQVDDPDRPGGTILETTHRGYRLGDRLIRAARVVVSKAPPPAAAETERGGTTEDDAPGPADEGDEGDDDDNQE